MTLSNHLHIPPRIGLQSWYFQIVYICNPCTWYFQITYLFTYSTAFKAFSNRLHISPPYVTFSNGPVAAAHEICSRQSRLDEELPPLTRLTFEELLSRCVSYYRRIPAARCYFFPWGQCPYWALVLAIVPKDDSSVSHCHYYGQFSKCRAATTCNGHLNSMTSRNPYWKGQGKARLSGYYTNSHVSCRLARGGGASNLMWVAFTLPRYRVKERSDLIKL